MDKKGLTKGLGWVFILVVLLVAWLSIIFDSSMGKEATTRPEINAPGGAEIDVAQNITKWYGSKTSPVEMVWRNLSLKAYYLEYDRRQEIIKCQDRVVVVQNETPVKTLQCGEMVIELKRSFLTARDQVRLEYDEQISLSGNRLEWDQKKDQFKLWDQPQIFYKDWEITGNRIEGEMSKGAFTVWGPVKGNGPEASSFQAGKVIYDQKTDKIYLQDNPVLVQDSNELSAGEIVYDLKSGKFYLNNQSKFKVTDESK
ncbi:MAG TPA: LptA/OstA family protein [Bacillota bacterium]|nr:LptA/OstA family protein [Bacillota bacterium]